MLAGTSTLNDLFNSDKVYGIPFFQRGYVWDEIDWKRCLDDLIKAVEANQPHFMGALIFKRLSDNSRENYSIIDGQQRLTTILMLLKVFAEKVYASSDFYKKFYTSGGEKCFIHNQMDNEVFAQLFYEQTRLFREDEQRNKVFRCFQYFWNNIDDGSVVEPQKVMELIYFVKIELEAEDDEQEIFETINSLGVDLTSGELLKNELFSREDAEYYFKTWGKSFEEMGRREYWERTIAHGKRTTFNMQELFLRSYYFLSAELPSGYEPVGSLFKNYQRLLKNQYPGSEKRNFIADLIATADVFRKTFEPLLLENPARNFRPVHRLVLVVFALQITNTIPYILFVLKNAAPDEQDKIFLLLEMYLLRRNICNFTASRYNLQFKQFIKDKILTSEKLLEKLKCGVDNTSKIPSSRDIINAIFSEDRNLRNNRLGAVLFYLFEVSVRSNIPLAPRLDGYDKYSFVELLPKKIELWLNLDKLAVRDKKAYEYASKLLGNFVLSPKKISANKTWKDKRAIIASECQAVYSTHDCILQDQWNPHTIILRTCKLAEAVLQVWSCEIDEEFTLPDEEHISLFLEKAEIGRDVYSLVQVINNTSEDEIKTSALELLENILFFGGNVNDYESNFTPHLLTEDMAGKKPFKWTWNNVEYTCSHWSDLFKELTGLLYGMYPEQMREFCSYGGDLYICSTSRKKMTKSWDKIGDSCYIYTAINTQAMQKSIQNMLRAMNVDIRSIHVYLRA